MCCRLKDLFWLSGENNIQHLLLWIRQTLIKSEIARWFVYRIQSKIKQPLFYNFTSAFITPTLCFCSFWSLFPLTNLSVYTCKQFASLPYNYRCAPISLSLFFLFFFSPPIAQQIFFQYAISFVNKRFHVRKKIAHNYPVDGKLH